MNYKKVLEKHYISGSKNVAFADLLYSQRETREQGKVVFENRDVRIYQQGKQIVVDHRRSYGFDTYTLDIESLGIMKIIRKIAECKYLEDSKKIRAIEAITNKIKNHGINFGKGVIINETDMVQSFWWGPTDEEQDFWMKLHIIVFN